MVVQQMAPFTDNLAMIIIMAHIKLLHSNLMWFDRTSSLICGNKMPTRCNRGFYCRSYCLLDMFRAPLCPSSGAQEYYTVVAACGYFVLWFSSCWSGVELRDMCPVGTPFQPDSARKRAHNQHEAYQLSCVQRITPDDGHRRCPKHVEFYDKNEW